MREDPELDNTSLHPLSHPLQRHHSVCGLRVSTGVVEPLSSPGSKYEIFFKFLWNCFKLMPENILVTENRE